jgi:type 1 fimbria pilin
MFMKRSMLIFVSIFCTAIISYAQEAKTEKKPAGDVTITGEVIDSQCYLSMGAKGDDHRQCAIDCAKGGIPLAILEDKTNNVYFVGNGKDQMKGANDMLADHVAEKVTVKGKLVEKGGAKMIVAKSVEKVK